MKLKKLTIDNIASIEHAVIDFDAAPLADERLFLITGETGSGKSTIIDCICLALYNSTPRLSSVVNAKNNGYENRLGNGTIDNYSLNDAKQLMRRGSVSALITLSFDDDQGTPWTVTWGVQRANKRPNGRLQSISRTLKTDDGIEPAYLYQNTTEVKNKITEMLELDIDQFMRTVVLAQGKFAEFINSKDDEKADLLEKMTGTGIYSEISKKIFQITKEKKSQRDLLKSQLDSYTLLDEEQKATIQNEIASLKQQQSHAQHLRDMAKAMTMWLTTKQKNERDLSDKETLLAEKRAQTQSAKHIAERAMVKDWTDTTVPRIKLAEKDAHLDKIKTLDGKRTELQGRFDALCADLRAAIADLDSKQGQLDEITASLRQQEPNKAMYEAIGQIKSAMKHLSAEQNNVEVFSKRLDDDQRRLPEVEKAVNAARTDCSQKDTALQTLQQRLDAMGVPQIRERKDKLSHLRQSLLTLKGTHEAAIQAHAAVKDLDTKIEEQRHALDKESAVCEERRTSREQAWEAVEQQKSWNELLAQAHQTLHIGDKCPVCGNVIEQLLPEGNSKLDQLLARLKQADDLLRDTETRIQAASRLITEYGSQLENAKQVMSLKDDQYGTHRSQAQMMLMACDMNDSNLDDADALMAQIDAEANLLNASLQQADELAKAIHEAQQATTAATRAYNQATIQLNKVNDSILYQRQTIDASRDKVVSLTQELNGLLVMPDWKEQLTRDPEFIHRLKTEADTYHKQASMQQQLTYSIAVSRTSIPAMQEAMRNIDGLADNGHATDVVPTDLDEQWRRFENRYLDWKSALQHEQESAQRASQALEEYLDSHPGITLGRLAELNRCQPSDIEDIQSRHATLEKAIIATQGEITELRRQQVNIAASKPEFDEQDPERLAQLHNENSGLLEQLEAEIAKRMATLEADQQSAKQMGETRQLLQQADAVYRKWAQLNENLGSSDGKTFRHIAQSYILGDLLSRANQYLHHFNNRYELLANPGKLSILARDTWQGDLTSVCTLSGGECFMVSLALALALSSMSGRIFCMDTLFIDEGFGSLSPNYLDKVMETLNRLYDMGGRRVGIISHVEMLKDRITTQIQVARDPSNNTVSRVKVVSA